MFLMGGIAFVRATHNIGMLTQELESSGYSVFLDDKTQMLRVKFAEDDRVHSQSELDILNRDSEAIRQEQGIMKAGIIFAAGSVIPFAVADGRRINKTRLKSKRRG